jgi:hypothetical protein
MTNTIRDQFVADMQAAGLCASTQKRYLCCVGGFMKWAWTAPEDANERDIQAFLIGLRDRDVARETFRGYRFALEFLFVNTLRREWALFKKDCVRRPSSVCLRC